MYNKGIVFVLMTLTTLAQCKYTLIHSEIYSAIYVHCNNGLVVADRASAPNTHTRLGKKGVRQK